MRDVVIEQRGDKGRSFRALLLAYVEADLLWPGGAVTSDNIRPVWAMFGGSDSELRAFAANLLSGRAAKFHRREYNRGKNDRVEFLRSAGFQTKWQREPEGSLLTVYLAELFLLDPGLVDQHGIQFVLLPSQKWHAAQQIDVTRIHQHATRCRPDGHVLTVETIADWTPTAYLFAAYLDRRTRCPLVADGAFYMQLMLSCLRNGLATFTNDSSRGFGVNARLQFYETCTADVGLKPGLAFGAAHETFEALLAQEVDLYFKIIRGS